MLRDGFLHVFQGDPESLPLYDQFFEIVLEKLCFFGFASRWPLGDQGAKARADFQKPSGYQCGNHFVGRIRIDFQIFAKGAN